MFSLARRLIEKRVVDVDAVPFLFFCCFFLVALLGLQSTSHSMGWFWSGEVGDNAEVSPGNPLGVLRYTVSEKGK